MAISLSTAQVIYAAQSKILELAEDVQASSTFRRVKNKIKVGEALIRYTRVLQTDDTLTNDEQTAICQHMINIGNLYDFPASPTITTNSIFNFSAGAQTGPQGPQGIPGQDGGGTDYNQFSLTAGTHTIDSFDITDSDAAEWSYKITGSSNLRIGRIATGALSDGSSLIHYEYSSIDIGDTSPVVFTTDYSGGLIRLRATISSGTWNISGTRYFIPNNGAGTAGTEGSVLPLGQIFIGNSINEAEAKAVSGDISINSSGVVSISPNVIVNGDISNTAAIAVSKLAPMGGNSVVITTAGGVLTVSPISPTKLGYLTDVTSNLQAQLDSKIGSVTGAISTVVSSNLTPNRAVIANSSGKLAVSATTDTQIGYLSTTSSNVQTQLNGKQATITGAATTITSSNLTANKLLVSNGSGKVAASSAISIDGSNNIDLTAVSGHTLTLNGSHIILDNSPTSDTRLTLDVSSILVTDATSFSITSDSYININGVYIGETGGISTEASSGPFLRTKIIDIGDWDMDANPGVNVTHGLSDITKIRSINVIVRTDTSNGVYDLIGQGSAGVSSGNISSVSSTTVNLVRTAAGTFDSTGFDSTGFNRGWITITYEI